MSHNLRAKTARTKTYLLHSNFCHFEMRCGAPIEKSLLHFASLDFSHPFEMTLGILQSRTFYPSPFPFDQLFVWFVSVRLRSATETFPETQPLTELHDNRTVTLFLRAVERGFTTTNRRNRGFLVENQGFVSLFKQWHLPAFRAKWR